MKKKVVPTLGDGGQARDKRIFESGVLRTLNQNDDRDGFDHEAPLSEVYTSREPRQHPSPLPTRPTPPFARTLFNSCREIYFFLLLSLHFFHEPDDVVRESAVGITSMPNYLILVISG